MAKLDLHMHSKYSDDGEFSIPEIVDLCKVADMDYIAVTDHNSVRGVKEALKITQESEMKVISGIELDCIHEKNNFHLLGYHFDYTRNVFDEIEESILKQEQNAAEEKIELFQKETGILLSKQKILSEAKNGIVTGELIAEILLNQEDAQNYSILKPYLSGGKRSDNPYVNFYWDFFSQGKAAYVAIPYISLQEAADLIKEAGGIAVLAHPGVNLSGNYNLLESILKTGIDGIEAYSSYHSKSDMEYFAEAGRKNNILLTCGSDFHGKTKPAIAIGGHGAEENMGSVIKNLQYLGIL